MSTPRGPALDDQLAVALRPQPPPRHGLESFDVWPTLYATADSLAPELGALCRARNQQGVAKYGVPLRTHDARSTAIDLLQELLDAAVYAQKLHLEEHSDSVCGWAEELLGMAQKLMVFAIPREPT
jgi:hypothetical protein